MGQPNADDAGRFLSSVRDSGVESSTRPPRPPPRQRAPAAAVVSSRPRRSYRSSSAMLSFGVTVLPDPPWQRLVELMQLAEQNGFDYGWTYDSHVLWQEPYPLLTLAAMRHRAAQARPERDQPGHARADGDRERVRDAPGRLRRPDGHGHRPRRLGPARRSASSRSRSPSSRPPCRMIRDLMNGRPVRLERHRDRARSGRRGRAGDPALRRRLRPAGARDRRPRRRRRDHPARRPGDRRVDRRAGARGRPRRRAATRPR